MTTKISTGLAEYLAGTGCLRDAFHGTSRISIYAGVEPAGADLASDTHTLLCVIEAATDPLEFDSIVTNGVVSKDTVQTWNGTILATGLATWFRLEDVSDDRSADPSALRLQGSIGTVVGDMIMTNPNLVATNVKVIENFRMSVPTSL